jgi:hypothetical protein
MVACGSLQVTLQPGAVRDGPGATRRDDRKGKGAWARGERSQLTSTRCRAGWRTRPHTRTWRFTYHGGWWQAVIREDAGETVISRYELKALLDKLESLDPPESVKAQTPPPALADEIRQAHE